MFRFINVALVHEAESSRPLFVEIRVDADDNPHVLELNGNPSWPANSCLAQLAGLIGIDYGDLPKEIIRLTIKRYQDRFKNLGREGKR